MGKISGTVSLCPNLVSIRDGIGVEMNFPFPCVFRKLFRCVGSLGMAKLNLRKFKTAIFVNSVVNQNKL